MARPEIQQATIEIATPVVEFGNALQFTLATSSAADRDQDLIIDFSSIWGSFYLQNSICLTGNLSFCLIFYLLY